MAYVKKALAENEQLLFRGRFNWTYDAATLFWLLIGLAPTILRALEAAGIAPEAGRPFGPAFNSFTVSAGILGGVIALVRYVEKWTTVVAVTTLRLILKSGIIARLSAELSLDKIERIVVHQTLLGRALGYGHITVFGTGGSEIEFPDLADPIGLRRQIEHAIAQNRRTL
jgi:hypothetical protein